MALVLANFPTSEGIAAETVARAGTPWSPVVLNDGSQAAPQNSDAPVAGKSRETSRGRAKAEARAAKTSRRSRNEAASDLQAGSNIETGTIAATTSEAGRVTPPAQAPAVAAPPAAKPVDPTSLAGKFCLNIKPQVEEFRLALQKKTLADVEAEIEKRITALDSRIQEYKEWVARRDEFAGKAQDSLVKIYSKMKPDAAAQQLAAIDVETAAAVLLKLDPRVSSAILNDMEPKLAATLASTIAGAARVDPDPVVPPAEPAGEKPQ